MFSCVKLFTKKKSTKTNKIKIKKKKKKKKKKKEKKIFQICFNGWLIIYIQTNHVPNTREGHNEWHW